MGSHFSLFCQSTKLIVIVKRCNPGFHNRAIDVIFAWEPVNKVRNELDVSRTQNYQQFFFTFAEKHTLQACAAVRLILANIAI